MIEYPNTIEDLMAFNRFHLENSPAGKRSYRWGALVVGVLIVLFGAVSRPEDPLALLFVLGIAGALAYARLAIPITLAYGKRFHAEGRNKGTLGWHRLILTEGALREENEAGTQETRFEAIERVVESKTHTFICVGAVLAHVIPKSRLTKGNLASFLRELNARL